jgi:hypothetical protein
MNGRKTAVIAAGIAILFLFCPAVAFMTPPAGSYELTAIEGEFQTFSGNSFDGEPAYLAFTGEGLSPVGVRLDDPSKEVVNGDPYSFTIGEMTSSDKWAYEWDTENIGLEPGTYTVYILQDPVDLRHLDDHCYFVVDLTVVPKTKESPLGAPAALIGLLLVSLLAGALFRR